MHSKLLFLLVFLITLSAVPASAHNVTIVDPMDCYEYSLYSSDGTLIGDYTANDTLALDGSGDYRIFVKPSVYNVAADPLVAIDWIEGYLPAVLVCGLILIVLGAFALIVRRVVK